MNSIVTKLLVLVLAMNFSSSTGILIIYLTIFCWRSTVINQSINLYLKWN